MLRNTLIGIYSVWFVLIVLIGTNYMLAGFQILTPVNMKCMGYWIVMSYKSERVRHFWRTHHFYLQGRRVSQARNQQKKTPACSMLLPVPFSLILNVEAICFSETSDYFHRPTRLYIPEHRTVRSHRCGNLRSNRYALYIHQANISYWNFVFAQFSSPRIEWQITEAFVVELLVGLTNLILKDRTKTCWEMISEKNNRGSANKEFWTNF
jgi:hypothetical protein